MFVGPTIFLLLAINIFPLIWTIICSLHQLPRQPAQPRVNIIGLRNYERILTDSDIWLTMQATAHFLFWTIVFRC
jgi:multiple sugar transport system permease protein